jgi:hypothetical protein
MRFIRCTVVRSSADVISGILNCVCPECGGRMGERGEEFRCQGECLTDWRQTWERASANFRFRPKRSARKPSVVQITGESGADPSDTVGAGPERRPATPNRIFAGEGLPNHG